jgi:hypothetical protein
MVPPIGVVRPETILTLAQPNSAVVSDPSQPTADLVQRDPKSWQTLFSSESWSQFCATRFGELGRRLSFATFHVLDKKDGHPDDDILDVSMLSPDDIDTTLQKFKGTEKGADDVLSQMRTELLRHRSRIENVTATRIGNSWWGVRENGHTVALTGDALLAALREQALRDPMGQVRVALDKNNFAGRVANDLNPDRRGIWAAAEYSASLAGTGGMGVYVEDANVVALPYKTKLAGFDPAAIENVATVTVLLSAIIAVLAFGRRGVGGPVPVQAVGERGPITGRAFEIPQQVMASLEAMVARGRRRLGAVYVGGTSSQKQKQVALAPTVQTPTKPQPQQVPYKLADWVTPKVIAGMLTGHRLEYKNVTVHIIADQLALYRDARNPKQVLEGFLVLDGHHPVTLVPLSAVRRAMLRDATEVLDVKSGGVRWEVSQVRDAGKYNDLLGVRIRSQDGRHDVTAPWLDSWRTQSVGDFHYLNSWGSGLMPKDWNGRWFFGRSGRDALAARLIERQDLITEHLLTNEQRDAAGIVAVAIVDPQMDAGAVSRLAQIMVQGGRPAFRGLTSRVADRLRAPVEHLTDYDFTVGKETPFRLSPELISGIEADIYAVYNLFPVLHRSYTLYPHQNQTMDAVR